MLEETQTYGSLIQIKLRVSSSLVPQYFVKDSQKQSQHQQCKNSKLCQHFILLFLIFDISSVFDIPGSARSRPGNYSPYILGKAWKKIDGHLISYKYHFLGAAPHTAGKDTVMDCFWTGTFHKLISLTLSRKFMWREDGNYENTRKQTSKRPQQQQPITKPILYQNPEQGTWAESDHKKYLMWVKKSTNDRGHITSGRREIAVFWQQWDLTGLPGNHSRKEVAMKQSSLPCEQASISPAVMAPEDLGARTSMHPAAVCQEGDSFSTSQVQDYQVPTPTCQTNLKCSALWLFQSQECLLPPILVQQWA